jgi:hypothetical protein
LVASGHSDQKTTDRYSISLLIQEEQDENWHVLYDHAYAGVFGLILRPDRYDRRFSMKKSDAMGKQMTITGCIAGKDGK